MKAAAIQMTSTRDVQANLAEAGRLVAEAATEPFVLLLAAAGLVAGLLSSAAPSAAATWSVWCHCAGCSSCRPTRR